MGPAGAPHGQPLPGQFPGAPAGQFPPGGQAMPQFGQPQQQQQFGGFPGGVPQMGPGGQPQQQQPLGPRNSLPGSTPGQPHLPYNKFLQVCFEQSFGNFEVY